MIWAKRDRLACPFCGRTYAKSLSGVRLGTGSATCPRCHKVFADGSIEWPAASPVQKREYLFPERARIYLIGNVLLGVALATIDPASSNDRIGMAVVAMAVASSPLLFRLAYRALEIRMSKRRFERAELARLGYHSSIVPGSGPL